MRAALEGTIARVRALSEERGIEEPHQLNLCVTDGDVLVATRYCSGDADAANSLYVHEGRRYVCVGDVCHMVEPDERGGAVLVASEALSDDEGWDRVPGNHTITVGPDRGVELRPI